MRQFPLWLIGALAWGALTGGARFPWAYVPLAAVCAILGAWALRDTRGYRQRQVRHALAGLAVFGLAIAIQLMPLPLAMFTAISPAADRFLASYEVAYAINPPAFHPLSIAPALTATALALCLSLGLLLAGLLAAIRRARLDVLVGGLVALGVLLAVIGVVQRAAVGIEPLVYGIWQATPLSSPFGPFLNRNHYAGWMVMVLPVALGYAGAVMAEARRPRGTAIGSWLRWSFTPDASRFMVAMFAALAMGTALMLTGSRSGVAAFAVSLTTLGLMVARRARTTAARWLFVTAAAGLFIGAAAWAGPQAILNRFSGVSADLPGRFTAWADALRLAGDFPVAGTGLGTFGIAMIVYQSGERIAIYSQAHNDYLQLLAEGGVLLAVPIAVALVWTVREARRRLREDEPSFSRWIRLGAMAGLTGIAAQSVVEYSLQRPGNTALCVLLVALAISRSPDPTSRTGAYADRI